MKNPEKQSLKFTAHFILSTVLLLFVFTSCEDPIISITGHEQELSFIAGTEGGAFTALNGNIDLKIPRDALNTEVKFRINIGSEGYGNDFIIKSIEIYPKSTIFKNPVRMRLKYDGQLSNGKDPSGAKSLAIYHFKNEAAFDKRNPSDMTWINKCFVNKMDYSIETEINSGGIFAIGEENLDQTDHE